MNRSFSSLKDVRQEIDETDRQLVELLAKRWALAMAAVPFKTQEPAFRDNGRRLSLLRERMSWGQRANLPSHVTETLFDSLIDLVEEEQSKYRQKLDL